MRRGEPQRAEHRSVPAEREHGVAVGGERRLRSPGDLVGQPLLALGPHELHPGRHRPGADLLERALKVTFGT